VVEDLGFAFVEEEGDGGCGLGDHAHGAVDDGVAGETFAGEGGVVAGGPDGGAQGFDAEEGAGAAGFGGGDTPTVGIPPTPNPSPQGGGGFGGELGEGAGQPAGNGALRLGHAENPIGERHRPSPLGRRWPEGPDEGAFIRPKKKKVAPHQFGRMTYGRAITGGGKSRASSTRP
jgi:hypothetical protein